MFNRNLEFKDWLVIILSTIILSQHISSVFQKSEGTVSVSDDGLVAIIPIGETLIAKSFKSTISITPTEKYIEFKWYFLGWHKNGTYPIPEVPTKLRGFTIERFTSSGGDSIQVTKPNNIFYTFR